METMAHTDVCDLVTSGTVKGRVEFPRATSRQVVGFRTTRDLCQSPDRVAVIIAGGGKQGLNKCKASSFALLLGITFLTV